jgi:hypothetical protein
MVVHEKKTHKEKEKKKGKGKIRGEILGCGEICPWVVD